MADNFETLTKMDAGEIDHIRVALDNVTVSAERVSRTITRAFASAIISGKSLDTVLNSMALSLSRMVLNASLKPLQHGFSSAATSAFSALTGVGGGGGPSIAPFADGGIVSSPVYFGSGGRLGLIGERGAEAILPLARGPDGKLGLAAGGTPGKAVNVTVNISTPDVGSFARSQVQVTGALARAVGRGRRGL